MSPSVAAMSASNAMTTTQETEQSDHVKSFDALKFDDMAKSRVALILSSLGALSFLFAIEQTIVATAVPGIGAALKAHGSLTWITSSYLLTTTAFQPLTGRLADAIGAKRFLLIEFWIFITGNIIAGASKNLTQLVAGRLISGVGGAGLLSVSCIILTHLTHERQRGLYFNLINLIFSFADAIGPLVGGAFVQSGHWEWIFYFNALLAPFITFVCVRFIQVANRATGDTVRETIVKLDFAGMISMISALTFLVVALNLGGESFPFNSPTIIGLFCASSVSFLAFLLMENCAAMPVVPLHLFSKWEWRNVPIMTASRTLLFFPLYCTTFYLPVFLQVTGVSALNAGTLIIPFLSMAAIASTIVTYLSSKYQLVRPMFMCGLAILPVGLGLMATLNERSSLGQIVGYTLICGVGFGSGTQISLVIAQAGLPEDLLSTVTAIVSSAPNLGGVLGISIIGSVINNSFRMNVISLVPTAAVLKLNDPVGLAHDGSVPHDSVVKAYTAAWRDGYIALAVIAATQFCICLMLRPIELSNKIATSEQAGNEKQDPDHGAAVT